MRGTTMSKIPAQIAYEAHAVSLQGYPHEEIKPRWEQLPPHIQRAWIAAANDVLKWARDVSLPTP
jgi:hypothetical protein